MAEPLSGEDLDSAVDPARIVQQSFDVERRGFDQRQVQQYLRAIAQSLRDAQQREAEMRTRLGKAIRRAEAAEQTLRDSPSHDTAELNREFGEQVASVLEAARVVGDQRINAAEKSARQLLANAKTEATRLRNEAEGVLDERTAEAEAAAAEIVAAGRAEADEIRARAQAKADDLVARAAASFEQAQVEADEIRAQGQNDADELVARAAETLERAQAEGDSLIAEAEEARAQILEDMERRRRQARAQVERLRVGRDRLLRSYDVVRRTLEETTVELRSSLAEAKVRGDGAARAVLAEEPASREHLEAELRDAKMIGRLALTSQPPGDTTEGDRPARRPRPALQSPALPRPLDPPPQRAEADGPETSDPSAPKSKPAAEPVNRRSAVPPQPKAPAVAPKLTASPAATDEPVESESAPDVSTPTGAPPAGTAAPVPAESAEADALDEQPEAIADPDADAEAVAALDDVDEELDAELAELEDKDLSVIEPSDDIEEVVAVPLTADPSDPIDLTESVEPTDLTDLPEPADPTEYTEPIDLTEPSDPAEPADPTDAGGSETEAAPAVRSGLFDALRAQRAEATEPEASPGRQSTAGKETFAEPEPTLSPAAASERVEGDASATTATDLAAQRDAVIADATGQLESRLKRALADEQNELLSGIRAAGKDGIVLTSIVGTVDEHVARYVVAIHEVAAGVYGAGAALVDADVSTGVLPAGAVEELLAIEVVLPIRERLESLDRLEVEAPDVHLDPVRAFYRQRKTDHLGRAAARLANLLCVAGVCDSLPADEPLPWRVGERANLAGAT